MRRVFKPIKAGESTARDYKVLRNQFFAALAQVQHDDEDTFMRRLDYAEDILTGLGLADEFHLSIWAEHRRRRASLKTNGRVVDKPPTKHEKSSQIKPTPRNATRKASLRRAESY